MKKKRWMRLLLTGIMMMFPTILLTACKNEETGKASPAYYVISEELDSKKTTDKVQEILENAESQIQEIEEEKSE